MEKWRVFSGNEFCEGVELPTLQPKALGPFKSSFAFSEYDPGTKFSEEHNTLVQSHSHRSETLRGILIRITT